MKKNFNEFSPLIFLLFYLASPVYVHFLDILWFIHPNRSKARAMHRNTTIRDMTHVSFSSPAAWVGLDNHGRVMNPNETVPNDLFDIRANGSFPGICSPTSWKMQS